MTAPPGNTVRPVGGGTGLKLASLAGAPQMLAAAAVTPVGGAARARLPARVLGDAHPVVPVPPGAGRLADTPLYAQAVGGQL